jgi:hypothetical protein
MQHRTAVALAGRCILVAGCGANSNRATPTPTASTTVPPAPRAALDGLLAQIAAEVSSKYAQRRRAGRAIIC